MKLKTPKEYGYKWDQWHPEQVDAFDFLMGSDSLVSVLEAPPGIGKTTLATLYARHFGGYGVILTSTKQLQSQYAEDHQDTYSMYGQSNYPCLEEFDGYGCDVGPCHLGYECPLRADSWFDDKEGKWHHKAEECLYYDAKNQWMDSTVSVTNYSYYLNIANYDRQFNYPDLLICDEAHMIEDELLSFVGVQFNKKTFEKFFLPWMIPSDMDEMTAWIKEVDKTLQLRSSELMTADKEENLKRRRDMKSLSGMMDKVDLIAGSTGRFVIETDKNQERVELKPVFAREHSWRLFRNVQKVVLMSATIRPYQKFIKMLGLPKADADFLSIPSPFEAERRPVYYWPVAYMNWRQKEENYPKIVEAIDRIIESRVGKSGIIHTVSFDLAEFILRHSKYSSRMLHHFGEGADRESVIEEFKEAPAGTFLVSPSIEAGVDFPYEQCSINIICKTPYGNLKSKQIKEQMEDDQGIYEMKALHRLIQMIGRAMRAPDDKGETFVLDEAAGNLVHWRRRWMPEHVTDAWSRIKGPEEIEVA